MLDVLNRYAHGYVAVPVIVSCKKRGLFKLLKGKKSLSSKTIAREFNANEGHLLVALRLLESIGWLVKDKQNKYRLTKQASEHEVVPEKSVKLLSFAIDQYLAGKGGKESLKQWLVKSEQKWDTSQEWLCDFLDGLLVIPLFLALREYARVEGDGGECVLDLKRVNKNAGEALSRWFGVKGWTQMRQGKIVFTDSGRFLLDRIFITATVASYRPMWLKMDELLFGDAKKVFKKNEGEDEGHVDRKLNVLASGFQHAKYFSELDEMIVSVFSKQPYEQQPRYVADMGCGNGTLLKRIYEVVRDRTPRGKCLNEYPLVLLGLDYNEASLRQTRLCLSGLPFKVMHADINDPLGMLDALGKEGIEDKESILHVRSFLDHDRCFIEPKDKQAFQQRKGLGYFGTYVDEQGRAIAPALVMQSLVEHFGRWAQIVGRHGLIVLEVHCLDVSVTRRFLSECENLHYDAFHGFSKQYLVEARTFVEAAAENGLVAKRGHRKYFPKGFRFTRITLNAFDKCFYKIRHAYLRSCS